VERHDFTVTKASSRDWIRIPIGIDFMTLNGPRFDCENLSLLPVVVTVNVRICHHKSHSVPSFSCSSLAADE